MRRRDRFRDRTMQDCYSTARRVASDNFSEFYHGHGSMGPRAPRRGAGHRCAFWDGWFGVQSLYARDRKVLGYAFWAAGQDNRRWAMDMAIVHAAMREISDDR